MIVIPVDFWLWTALGGAVVCASMSKIKKADRENKLKRFYYYIASAISVLYSFLLLFAKILNGNAWMALVMAVFVMFAEQALGDQLIKLIKSKLEGALK